LIVSQLRFRFSGRNYLVLIHSFLRFILLPNSQTEKNVYRISDLYRSIKQN